MGDRIVFIVGLFSLWFVLFFPFAWACRRIALPDAFHPIEAYVLGQVGGPLGLWLVFRGNRVALARRTELAVTEDIQRVSRPEVGLSHEEIEKRNRVLGRPESLELPGGYAWQPPPGEGPKRETGPVCMETFAKDTVVRQTKPETSEERLPHEPPMPPQIKASQAFQPPPADYQFTHCDEAEVEDKVD
jgi:hypothetical protein